jgi:hypothetical protein
MAANRRRLAELGMATELAKEVASQIESGGLQIGTTGSTAMAGNRTPTATIRGGALLMPVQADSTADEIAEIVADFNALLAKLRTAGLLATS